MLLPWMLYSALVAGLLALAAFALERVLAWTGRPLRFAWLGAAGASLGLAGLAWLWPSAAAPVSPVGLPSGTDAPLDGPFLPRAMDFAAGPALQDALPWIWAATSASLFLLLIGGAIHLRRQGRRWSPAAIDGTPVLLSPGTGPAVVGLLRTRIVLPRWVAALPEAERRLVLAHEEEHRRGRDPLAVAALLFSVALMPWSPALWWQLRRLRLAIEVDCDQRVLRRSPDRARYGRLLVAVGARAVRRPFAAPALTEPRTFLEKRIRAMTSSEPTHVTARAGGLLFAAAGLVLLACEAPRPTEPASPAPTPVRVPESPRIADPSAEPRPVRGNGRVTGMVLDAETGQPIAGAQVFVEGRGRGTLTHTNGRYFIIGMEPGEYTIVVRHDGYATVRRMNVTIRGDVTRSMNVQLPPQRR